MKMPELAGEERRQYLIEEPGSRWNSHGGRRSRLVATACLWIWAGPGSAQQQVNISAAAFGADPMGELDDACELERGMLDVQVLARNATLTASAVKSVPGGWLVVDEPQDSAVSKGIVLVDEELREISRWRPGPGGPWSAPGVVGTLPGDEIFAVEGSTLLVPGRPGLLPTTGMPSDAISMGEGSVVYGSGEGFFALDLTERSTTRLWSLEDFGMPWDQVHGLPPKFLVRNREDGTIYISWNIQSSIWSAEIDSTPQRILQRCVPAPLITSHAAAPVVELGTLGKVKASVSSTADFLVLESGDIIVLGSLAVGSQLHRSIELYASDGTLTRAWELPIRRAYARFAYRDPRRLLLLRGGSEEGQLVLLHVDAEGYPSR